MLSFSRKIVPAFFIMATGICQLSCTKMITVPQPINSITTVEMFKTNNQANTAMAGVYTQLVNGALSFSNGYTTILGGMSADEINYYGVGDAHILTFTPNQLLFNNSYTSQVWTSAYNVIYDANAVIEGIAGSDSPEFSDSLRTKLTGEAKFVRAFCYFYLTNLFGDVPLVLTIDFNKTRYMTKTPAAEVYRQIIQDLKDAYSMVGVNYPSPGAEPERIVPNKAVVAAMLARTYLYTKDYTNAAAQATTIIDNVSRYKLETDPNKVFAPGSKEAIWQLKQNTNAINFLNATGEGYTMLPSPLATGIAKYNLTPSLLSAFEPGDIRQTAWTGSTNYNGTQLSYAYKYKLGSHNAISGAASSEYYMVFRLAEMYLIRAEAAVHGAPGGLSSAITDLNAIRLRAQLQALSASLNEEQVMAAIAQERRIELFAEWGHRWLDLKRTGQAHAVLSAVPEKQPWAGDYQLLYPIPPLEIEVNPRIKQNDGY